MPIPPMFCRAMVWFPSGKEGTPHRERGGRPSRLPPYPGRGNPPPRGIPAPGRCRNPPQSGGFPAPCRGDIAPAPACATRSVRGCLPNPLLLWEFPLFTQFLTSISILFSQIIGKLTEFFRTAVSSVCHQNNPFLDFFGKGRNRKSCSSTLISSPLPVILSILRQFHPQRFQTSNR